MSRLREGHQPTKTEVALFTELKKVASAAPADLPDGTGPTTWPLAEIEAGYRATRVAASATALVEAHEKEGTLTRADLALEGLLHAFVCHDQALLRQRLLEHAAQVMLWAQELER